MEGRQARRRPDALRRGALGRVAGAAAALVVVLLVIAQLVLPGIAADRVKSKLGQHGFVQQVSVSAFPAIELLWHHSDSVTVRMRSYRDHVAAAPAGASHTATAPSSPAGAAATHVGPAHRLADLLASTAHTNSLNARVTVLQTGRLVLDNVVLTKNGNSLQASALLTQAHIDAALPGPFMLRPVTSPAGELAFRGTVHLLGAAVSLTAVLHTRNGALVVSPEIAGVVPSFLSLAVFGDPRIAVDSVSSHQVSGGWEIFAHAHLTGA